MKGLFVLGLVARSAVWGGSRSEGDRGGNTGEVSGAQRTSITFVSSLGTYVMDFGKHRGKTLSEVPPLVIAVTHSLNHSSSTRIRIRILAFLVVTTCVLVNLRVFIVLKNFCAVRRVACARGPLGFEARPCLRTRSTWTHSAHDPKRPIFADDGGWRDW